MRLGSAHRCPVLILRWRRPVRSNQRAQRAQTSDRPWNIHTKFRQNPPGSFCLSAKETQTIQTRVGWDCRDVSDVPVRRQQDDPAGPLDQHILNIRPCTCPVRNKTTTQHLTSPEGCCVHAADPSIIIHGTFHWLIYLLLNDSTNCFWDCATPSGQPTHW